MQCEALSVKVKARRDAPRRVSTVDLPEGADGLVTVLGEAFLQDEQASHDAAKKHFLEAYDDQDDIYYSDHDKA